MRFTFITYFLLVLSVSLIAAEEDSYSFDERDTNSTTDGSTGMTSTGAMTTTGSTTGMTTPVYNVNLGDQNVTVSLNLGGNRSLKIQFPAIGNFSATYSDAGSDISDYSDPDATSPSGFSYKGTSFFITLFYPNGSRVEGMTFSEPIIVSIPVDGASDTTKLLFYDTEKMEWTSAADTCEQPMSTVVDGTLQVSICHLTQFAVFDEVTTKDISKNHNTGGIIAAVIVIPIIIVAVIIALVAWTLLRKPHGNKRSHRDLEMESSEKRDQTNDERDDSDSSESEKEPPAKAKENNVELKVATSNDSDTDSSSDELSVEIKKPAASAKKDSEETDTDSDTDSE
jgi:hypothetical protein